MLLTRLTPQRAASRAIGSANVPGSASTTTSASRISAAIADSSVASMTFAVTRVTG